MLVTCRSRLPVARARVIEVGTVSVSAAIELVDHMLVSANPDDTRVRENECRSADLVRLCGLLPLALAIASYLLISDECLSVDVLADRLADLTTRLDELEDRK